MLRSNNKTAVKQERIDASGFAGFDTAIDAILEQLEQRGLQGIDGEPNVVIVLRHNGTVDGNGDKLIDIIAHIGSTKEQILQDMQTTLV